MRLEPLILNILAKDEQYTKKVYPHLKPDYFQKRTEKAVYELIDAFYKKYSRLPQKDVLLLELDSYAGMSEDEFDDAKKVINEVFDDEYRYDLEWLIDETELFCKEKAINNAIMQAVRIINGEDKKHVEGQIPSLLQDALAVSFDKNVGHDYFENAEQRFEFYNNKEAKIHCSIDILNKITNGGLPRKTLNLLIGPSGSGKSGVKCSLAADYLNQGYNVLYITLELAEERVAERIDANLFNVPIADIHSLSKNIFLDRIEKIKGKTRGRLITKEYPTSTASVANFRVLLEELKSKKNFVPDVVFVDYLGICASVKYKNASNINSYTYQTAVAEELRALAVEYDLLLWSSIQTNRSGMNTSDYDVEAIADSTGPLKTADFLLAIINTPDLKAQLQIILKQLKNRYGDPEYFKKFIVGMDFARMKMFNVENNAHLQETQKEIEKETKNRYSHVSSSTPTCSTNAWDFADD